MLDLSSPDEEIKRIIETSSPKEAYIKIAEIYGGKAAGRVLTTHYLPQLDLEERIKERIKIPSGIALTEEEAKDPEIGTLVQKMLKYMNTTHFCIRSSGDIEDGFEDNWAGVGSTKIIRRVRDDFNEEFTKDCKEIREGLAEFIDTKAHVIVDEFTRTDSVTVVYSQSETSEGRINVTNYYSDDRGFANIGGEYISKGSVVDVEGNLIPPKYGGRVSGWGIGDSFNIVDEEDFSVVTAYNFPDLSRMLFGPAEWLALMSSKKMLESGFYVDDEMLEKMKRLTRIRVEGEKNRTWMWDSHHDALAGRYCQHLAKRVIKEDIKDMARIAKAYEEKFGFPVDMEIGLRDDFHLFQLRPIVPKVVKAYRPLPKLRNIIFTTHNVNGAYHYSGKIYRGDFQDLGAIARTLFPIDEYYDTRENSYPYGYQYSSIFLGSMPITSRTYLTGHGGTVKVDRPKQKIYQQPLIPFFVEAIADRNGDKLKTNFDVQIDSDGAAGFISIPNPDELKKYKRRVNARIKTLEKEFFA